MQGFIWISKCLFALKLTIGDCNFVGSAVLSAPYVFFFFFSTFCNFEITFQYLLQYESRERTDRTVFECEQVHEHELNGESSRISNERMTESVLFRTVSTTKQFEWMYALSLMDVLLVGIRINYLIESLTLSNSRQRFLIQWKRIKATDNKAFNGLESERLWRECWSEKKNNQQIFTNIQLRQSLCRKRMHFVLRQKIVLPFFLNFNILLHRSDSVSNSKIAKSIDCFCILWCAE